VSLFPWRPSRPDAPLAACVERCPAKIPDRARIFAGPIETAPAAGLNSLTLQNNRFRDAVPTWHRRCGGEGIMISTNRSARDVNEPISFMRWVFARGSHTLTCETLISGPQAFDVCILPNWHQSEPTIERYDRFSRAVRRQAEIAREVRHSGWTLVPDEHRQTGALTSAAS
jgi:hypothetical protein